MGYTGPRPSGRRPSAGPAASSDAGGSGGCKGLPVHRPAAAFEHLRDRSDAVLEKTGSRPCAFLATLGPPAAHNARAAFARNLLQAGGIETVEAGATATADDVTAAFTAADTPVAVLCGTDALYAERGADTVAALRAAGARHVLLAGRADPPGLDGHLYAGCDALAVLDDAWAVLDEADARDDHAGYDHAAEAVR
jgi:methylmalonyl-CoA mutase